MIITREEQHRIVQKWDKQDKSTIELLAFFEGMQSIIAFMEKKTEDDFYANRLV